MLPKHQRNTQKSFEEVFSKGFFVSSSFFSLRVVFLTEEGKPYKKQQFSVVVGGKVTKSKPMRNKVKRQISECVTPLLESLPSLKAIIFVKKEALVLPFSDLKREIGSLLKRGVIVKSPK